jgi:DNA invertase Pin-like site-specific DNA recombinase
MTERRGLPGSHPRPDAESGDREGAGYRRSPSTPGGPRVGSVTERAKFPLRSVAIYGRISTGKEQQGHGLEAQAHACRDLLHRLELPLRDVAVYEEEGSGRRRDRPVLRRLLHDAAMHRFQILVVFRLDRLTRGGIAEMFRVLKALQGAGVRVYSVCETWWDPDAPTAELILAILAWAAEFESRAIGERVAAGIAARRAEAERRGKPFLWGRAKVSPLTCDPELPVKALRLRQSGLSWTRVAASLGVGRTTARRLCQLARSLGVSGTGKGEAKPKDGPRSE